MIQEDAHSFNGLSMDKHPTAQDSDKLTDALNVRFISSETGSSFVLSNELGTVESSYSFKGDYIGHCIVGDYLIIFAKEVNVSRIYMIDKNTEGLLKTLWEDDIKKGYLNLTKESFEAFGYVESDLIQKVYWVDANNAPRFINIMQYELLDCKNPSDAYKSVEDFNFINVLQLNEHIDIQQNSSGGTFNQGVLQYAFTYYNKYGSESKVFYISPMYYLGTEDRGLAPDKTTSASFNITVEGLDSYDYLRVYALHRTAIDEEPAVRIVDEVKLDGVNSVTVLDNGTKGYASAYDTFSYIGGTDFKANTICAKDGTMFFGNIEYTVDKSFLDIKQAVQKAYENGHIYLEDASGSVQIHCKKSNFYEYDSNLHRGGFKSNEYYKIAVQFQNNKCDWTEPIYLDNVILNNSFPYYTETTYIQNTTKLVFKDSDEGNALMEKLKSKYVRLRLCIAYKPYNQRSILAQGIISPTVYNLGLRSLNAPYVMSSWYFRPEIGGVTLNKDMITTGHNKPLGTYGKGMEIQNMVYPDEKGNPNELYFLSGMSSSDFDNYKHFYFVDENIVTFHSPDVENLRDQNFENTKLRIIGFVELNGLSQSHTLTTTETFGSDESGFKKTPNTEGYSNEIQNTIIGSNYVYQDSVIRNSYKQADTKIKAVDYKVCTFNKSGSVNNDNNRDSDAGTRSAVLKKNIHTSIQYFNKLYKVTNEDRDINIKKPVFFDSETVDLKQIDVSYLDTKVNYYGNVDEVSINKNKYSVSYEDSQNNEIWLSASYDDETTLHEINDPVAIRYKSNKHLVFAFDSQKEDQILLQPWIDGAGGISADSKHYKRFFDESRFTYNVIVGDTVGCIIAGKGKWKKNDDYNANDPDEFWRSKQFIQLKKIFGGSINLNISKNDLVLFYATDQNRWYIMKWTSEHKDFLYLADVGKSTTGSESVAVKTGSNCIVLNSSLMKEWTDKYSSWISGGIVKKDSTITLTKKGKDDNIYCYYYNDPSILPSALEDTVTTFNCVRNYFNVDQEYNGTRLLPLVELYRTDYNPDNYNVEDKTDIWLPASSSYTMDDNEFMFEYGDTWYGRYDELKTYPFTGDDENQVIEIGSFMCETVKNIDGRYDSKRGVIENFTATPDTFNVVNTVYSQLDNMNTYSILDEGSYKVNQNNTAVLYSLTKTNNAIVDDWTNITALNSLYLDGTKGALLNLKFYNNTIIAFQEQGISAINFNPRVQIPTSDNVPIQLANTGKVDGYTIMNHKIGLKHKDAICISDFGIYFVDKDNNIYFTSGEGFVNLSANHFMTNWCKENFDDSLRLYYDDKNKDVYFVTHYNHTLCYNEYLQAFQSFYSYEGTQDMFNFNDRFCGFYSNKLWYMHEGKYNHIYNTLRPFYFEFISNDNPTYSKTFDNLEMYCDTPDKESRDIVAPFNFIQVSNDYQDTGERKLTMTKRFNIWRTLIPRSYTFVSKGLDTVRGTAMTRIRNTWCKVKIGLGYQRFLTNNSYKVNLNYIKVKYNLNK
jgi:hypothetical protein